MRIQCNTEAFTNTALVEGFEGVLLASTFTGMQPSLGDRVQGSGPELRESEMDRCRRRCKKGRRRERLRGRTVATNAEKKTRHENSKTSKWATHMALRRRKWRVLKSLKEQQSSLSVH